MQNRIFFVAMRNLSLTLFIKPNGTEVIQQARSEFTLMNLWIFFNELLL